MCIFGPRVPDVARGCSRCPTVNVPKMSLLASIVGFSFVGLAARLGHLGIQKRNLFSSAFSSLVFMKAGYLTMALVFPCRPRRPRIGYGRIRLRWILGTLLGNPLLRNDPEEARENQREPAGEDELRVKKIPVTYTWLSWNQCGTTCAFFVLCHLAITSRHADLSVAVTQKLELFMYFLNPIFRTNNTTKTFQNLTRSVCDENAITHEEMLWHGGVNEI